MGMILGDEFAGSKQLPMKIHFLSLLRRCPWGGSEELWSGAAERLLADGHHVSACVKWWPTGVRRPQLESLAKRGLRLSYWGQHVPLPQRVGRIVDRSVRKLFRARNANADGLERAISTSTDLLVVNSPGNRFPVSTVEFCRNRGIRYALICQSVSESEWIADSELAEFRSAYRGAEAAFFVSHANLESTACQLAFRQGGFRVVSNPYKVDRSQAFQQPRHDTQARLAFVGRLEPEHKGLDLLFRALAGPSWRARDFHLNIYGTGRSAEQVKAMAAFLGIAERVTFHGHVDAIESVWRENELLVLPSRHEGLPLAVIEAMMCGRPCLVTDVSGNPEHVEDGRTGFVAQGATVNAVAVALERAWSARDRWAEMGRAAYESIRQAIPEDPVKVFAAELLKISAHDDDKARASSA